MANKLSNLKGVGLGWRLQTAWYVEKHPDVDFVEVQSDRLDPEDIPASLLRTVDRGTPVALHFVGLSLGSTFPEPRRIEQIRRLVARLRPFCVSDHIAYTEAGGQRASHFVPLPRTETQLNLVVEHARRLQDELEVPFAMENPATLLEWPESKMSENEFLSEFVRRSGCSLILDIANLLANARNFGTEPLSALPQVSPSRIAYAHVAGGTMLHGVFVDTHAHDIDDEGFALIARVLERFGGLPLLLERDENFGDVVALDSELSRLRTLQREDAGPRQRGSGQESTMSESWARGDVVTLQDRQAEVLRALTDPESPVPCGFWESGFKQMRRILVRKRANQH